MSNSGTNGFWSGIPQVNDWELGAAALAYGTAGGLSVFPLWGVQERPSAGEGEYQCRCPSGPECTEAGKHPLVGWKEGASADAGVIQEWWLRWPWANIGLHLGRSELLVLDLDKRTLPDGSELDGKDSLGVWASESGQEGQHTAWSSTGGGGEHLFFLAPEVGIKNCNGWLPGVDIKSSGGYVALSPSLHVSGRKYQWGAGGAGPARLSEALQAAARVAVQHSGGRGSGGTPGGSGEYSYAQSKLQGPPAGHRDVFFNAYAFELRKNGVGKGAALGKLRAVWEKTAQDGGGLSWSVVESKVDRLWSEGGGGSGGVEPDEDKKPENVVSLAGWTAKAGGGGGGAGGNMGSLALDSVPAPVGVGMDSDPRNGLNDFGAALRFAEVNADWHKYTPGLGWFAWDGTFWRPDRDGARVLADGWARLLPWYESWLVGLPGAGDEAEQKRRGGFREALCGANMQRRVLELARAQRIMRVEDADDWNPDPWLLCVLNGVVDLRTGKLRPGTAQDLCTNQALVEYIEGARSARWEQHVQMLVGFADGSRDLGMERYLQKWAGYLLSGDVEWQQFLVLYGNSNNGKSKFVEVLQEMLGTGEAGYSSVPEEGLLGAGGHNSKWADLAGKRLVFIDELENEMSEDTVKRMTGDSRIRADKKYKDAFTFRVQFKMAFATNNLPPIKDGSGAFWRRIRPVACLHQIPEEIRDPGFARKLAADGERSGILNWCLEGARLLLEEGLGEGSVPMRVQAANSEYRESEDQLGEFLGDTFEELSERGERDWWWYPNSVVWELYRRWCEHNGVRPEYGKAAFLRRVTQRGWGRDGANRRCTGSLVGSGMSKGLVGPRMLSEAFGIEWSPRTPRGIDGV